MSTQKKSFIEKVIGNDKLLIVISVILSVVIWAAVKINFSDNSTRTVSDIKINFSNSFSSESDFVPYYDFDEIYADVEVNGKGYNISSYSLSKDDITVEATGVYVDSPGYKVLNLSAKCSEPDIEVVKINPSTVTVFYDRQAEATLNVEARLNYPLKKLAKKNYYVGQPVPSLSTVDITGPSTVVEKIKKVYFNAEIQKGELPLKSTKELAAVLSYDSVSSKEAKFIECKSFGSADSDIQPTVTVPVTRVKSVPPEVNFVNEPKHFEKEPPSVQYDPEKIKIAYNPGDEEHNFVPVGTIDFRDLLNEKKTLSFEIDEKSSSLFVDKSISSVSATIDLSSFKKKTVDATQSSVVLLNQRDGYSYTVDLDGYGLDEIIAVGSEESLEKLTGEELQIEINVSSLSTSERHEQKIEISNISIKSDEIDDCWIYGRYNAGITVSGK